MFSVFGSVEYNFSSGTVALIGISIFVETLGSSSFS